MGRKYGNQLNAYRKKERDSCEAAVRHNNAYSEHQLKTFFLQRFIQVIPGNSSLAYYIGVRFCNPIRNYWKTVANADRFNKLLTVDGENLIHAREIYTDGTRRWLRT
jgi:hypothetical protein